MIGPPQKPLAASTSGTREPHDLSDADAWEDLLVPILRGGKRIMSLPTLRKSRERAGAERLRMAPHMRQFKEVRPYRFGLEAKLGQQRDELIMRVRNSTK